MADNDIDVLLVGIGGYGQNYVKELLDSDRDDYKIVGVVDPYADSSSRIEEIRERGIPIFPAMLDFYEKHNADYVCISSPIQYHSEQTMMALKKGAGVICEKPLSATVQEGYKMLATQKQLDRPVGIGYQWSFSNAIQSLKKDIIKGVLGKAVRLKTLVFWPRGFKYYNRSSWAGKKQDDNGKWILDSVANNATAHYLHNMFYVLGKSIEESAWPKNLQSELYRANDIENYDTAAVKVWTEEGVELLYLVTHATQELVNPRFCYEFENATVYFDQDGESQIVAEFKDGSQKVYGDPFADPINKVWIMLDAIKGKSSYLCGIEAALPHVTCINGMQESLPDITEFPEKLVKFKKDEQGNKQGVYVEGLSDILLDCYNKWELPHELGVEWAKAGREINLTGYKHFPSTEF